MNIYTIDKIKKRIQDDSNNEDIEYKIRSFSEVIIELSVEYGYELKNMKLFAFDKTKGNLSKNHISYYKEHSEHLTQNFELLSSFLNDEIQRLSGQNRIISDNINDKLLEFMNAFKIKEMKRTWEQVEYLCFYYYKITGQTTFIGSLFLHLLSDAALSCNDKRVKISSVIKALITNNVFRYKENELFFEFIPVELQRLDKAYGGFFTYNSSNGMYLDENKFKCKESNINNLIIQLNKCYMNECYDGCAVLIRRLIEVTFIKAYEHLHIEAKIKDNDGYYKMLDKIIKDACANQTLNLSRTKKELDRIRNVGNYSAHKLLYLATKKDLDDIMQDYRTILEELFYKAGLL